MFCWQARRKTTPTCLATDSRVQRGQQHDGDAIGSDAATSLRTKSMDTLGQPLVGRSWPLALLSHLEIMASPIHMQPIINIPPERGMQRE